VIEKDNKGWLDLTSGLGAVILGHGHESVERAMRDQLNRGIAYPLPHRIEEIVAEKLVSMLTWDGAESVRYGKNGADVTGAAVKLARAHTERPHVLYADYHGHHPWSMTEPPMNGGVVEPYSVRCHDRTMLSDMVETGLYSCVVLEPWPSNDPDWVSTPQFWEQLRKSCDRTGTLLVLDEMVSGFRCAPGGGAEILSIRPDLACYGKAIANGMPLSAIVGRYELIKHFEESVFFSTTHGGEALSLAAALATMDEIERSDVCLRVGQLGDDLISQCTRSGIKVRSSYPQRLTFDLSTKQLEKWARMGILCAGYANLTFAHYNSKSARDLLSQAIAAVAPARL
jgi:glutamate-1-semialdehyde aminotransferase